MIALIWIGSCKTIKRPAPISSQVQSFDPITTLDEDQIFDRALRPSVFEANVKLELERADRYYSRARTEILNDVQDTEALADAYDPVSKVGKCLQQGGTPIECAKDGSIPIKAAEYISKALAIYIKILSAYDPPVLVPPGTTEEELVELQKINPSYILSADRQLKGVFVSPPLGVDENGEQEDDYWEVILDNRCGGEMTTLIRSLCTEFVYIYYLHEIAADYLIESFTESPATQTEYYEMFLKIYRRAEEWSALLSAVKNDVGRKIMALNRGILDPQSIQTVPLVAVVGNPSQFVPKLQEYFEQYRSALKQEFETRIRIEQGNIAQISNTDALRNHVKEVKLSLNNQQINEIDHKKFTQEYDHFVNKLEQLTHQYQAAQKNFSLEFRNVFGSWDADTTKVGGAHLLKVRPNGSMTTLTFPAGFTGGAIDISAAASQQYRSNGIYYGAKPNTDAFSCKACSKVASSVGSKIKSGVEGVQNGAGKLQGAVGDAWDRNKDSIASFGKTLVDPMGMLGGGMGFPGMGKAPGGGIEGLIGKALSGVAKGSFKIMEGMLPDRPDGPMKMLTDLTTQINGVPYPTFESHVWNQVTDVNGYIVSESRGKSSGLSKGSSIGKSVGTSVDFGISITPFGVGATLGAGASTGLSQGTSEGVSAGKSSGQSLRVGFFSQKAYSPHFRVGMLLGQLQCADGNPVVPVGAGNVVVVDGEFGQCSGIKLFINDDLEGAGKSCEGKPCGGPAEITVTAQFIVDPEAMFSKMTEIFGSQEFQDTLSSAAYGNDPYGASWRIFQNLALGQSIPPDLLPRFKPVIDHYVTKAMNEKEMEIIALELKKLDAEVEKLQVQKSSIYTQLGALEELQVSAQNKDKIMAYVRTLEEQRLNVYRGVAEHKASRLRYWYGVFRQSSLYHNPGTKVPDLFKSDENMRRLLDTMVSEGQYDKVKPSINELSFEFTLDELKEKTFLDEILTQTTTGHCYVSFKDLGLGSEAEFFSKSDNGLASIRWVPRVQAFEGQGSSQLNPDFNNQVAESIKVQSNQTINGYYHINFETDPSKWTSSFNPQQDLSNQASFISSSDDGLSLRCLNGKLAGMGKIIGVSLSYNLKDFANIDEQHLITHVSHENFMYGYRKEKDRVGMKIYKHLDPTIDADFWGGDSASVLGEATTSVFLHKKADLVKNCSGSSGTPLWHSGDCMRKMLGVTVDASSLISKGVIKSFYNSYLGGTWNVYIPEQGWTEFMKNVENINFHIFYKQRTLVHSG